MQQSRLSFIVLCCILYTFGSGVYNAFATEITELFKGCPDVTGLSNFTLDELDGTYLAVAMYSKSLGQNAYDKCYKIKFTQINDERTNMQVVWKSGILPVSLNFGLLAESENGTFKMVLGETSTIPVGQAYILSNGTNIIYHSCRPGLVTGSSQEVLVLSKNETVSWTDEDKAETKAVLKANKLDVGYMKPVVQNKAECAGLKFLTNV